MYPECRLQQLYYSKGARFMDISVFFRSVLEQDTAPVVLCGLDHTIVYMNPAAAKRYEYAGGFALVGTSLKSCHGPYGSEMIDKVVSWFAESAEHNIVFESRNDEENKDVYMVALRNEDGTLIGYYEKHEYRNREQGKCYEFD